MTNSESILFQVPNQVGLGHMNRMGSVALALRKLAPAVRSIFVVEGSTHGFLESFAVPYITFPKAGRLYNSPHWQSWQPAEKEFLLENMATSILSAFQPTLVVFDCIPSFHIARAAITNGIRCALCIRLVHDFQKYASDPRVQLLLASEALLIVPHREAEFRLPNSLMSRAVYVGQIVRPVGQDRTCPHASSSKAIRRIVITGGGGGGATTAEYFNLALDACAHAKQRIPEIRVLLITGPLFVRWHKLNMPSGIKIIPFDPNFQSTCFGADLVISQAGYNTVNELLVAGVPAICIPAMRPFDDQFQRARSAAANSANIHCFEGNNVEDLTKLVTLCLSGATARPHLDDPDGASRAAECILNEIGNDKPTESMTDALFS